MAAYETDDRERIEEEELPGPADLESVLTGQTLTDALSYPPIVLEEKATLAEAIDKMRGERHGCVLLVREGKLSGIFTERDILMKIAGNPIDFHKTGVSAYMTADPVALPADSSVAFALNKMVVEGFRHIPIVDESGRPTGVVSMRDLIEYMSDFFRKDVLNLPPDPHPLRNRDGA
jgi:CBS domain-containing protein